MEKSKVSIVKGDELYSQIKKAVDLIGGIETFIKKGQTVMLKVNVTGPVPPENGSTTHPDFLDAVIQLLNEAGASQITVADGTGSATIGTIKVFEMTGYNYLLEKYSNVDFFDLNRDAIDEIPVKDPYMLDTIRIAHSMFGKWDVMINLPLLKTHFITGISGAIKNMKGCIPFAEKRRMHDINVNRCVADLSTALNFDLTIMDGHIGSEGLGPKEGTPVGMGVILASTDPVAIDSVAAAVMGFDVHEFEHICLAHQKGVGNLELNNIEVLGDSIDKVMKKFKPAIPTIPEPGSCTIINGRACSGCISAAVLAASRLEEGGVLKMLNERGIYPTFAIGSEFASDMEWKDSKNTFFLGNCAKHMSKKGYGNFFPGCPPAALHTTMMLADFYGIDDATNIESSLGCSVMKTSK